MIQKILVVIVGLVMSIVGALAPSGLFAAKDTLGDDALATTSATDEILATIRNADSSAFAKLGVLWIEVDGKRVTDDAWGTGELNELKFQVGVKDVEGLSMAVGDKLVPVHPTDTITIRMFKGDFAYRGLNTGAATLQLQGSVKTTLLNQGAATGKLQTSLGETTQATSAARSAAPGTVEQISYVVLTTGAKLDTVSVQVGGNRVVTQDKAAPAGDLGNLLVKWVKIDGKLIREYTWGNGPVSLIEFAPVSGDARVVSVKFGDKTLDGSKGEQMLVRDFVGEYLIYEVSGNMLRVRLDGYAGAITTGAEGGAPIVKGAGIPIAAFEVGPETPQTSDLILFKDRTIDDDGLVVFWRWDFGDGASSVLQDATHRYAKPGIYTVTLNVTDDDLRSVEVSRDVVIRNAEPAVSYDYLPKIITTDTLVQFTDQSLDRDGIISNWTWTFGDDKSVSHARHPSHRFTRSGNVDVTLSVIDDLGGKTTLVKHLLVRNTPPSALFTYGPSGALSGTPIRFESQATDRDGRIVSYEWNFGDNPRIKGAQSFDPAVTHTFRVPGTYLVGLTVTDDQGDSDTMQRQIVINNIAAEASFHWETPEGGQGTAVHFESTSTDADGFILLNEWNFGDNTDTILTRAVTRCTDSPGQSCATRIMDYLESDLFQVNSENAGNSSDYTREPPLYEAPPPVDHTYARYRNYSVQLCVTDNSIIDINAPGLLSRSCVTNLVVVNASAPRALIAIAPDPGHRDGPVTFTSVSQDIDAGDVITVVGWKIDGVDVGVTAPSFSQLFPTLGTHNVTLTVRDSANLTGETTRDFRIVNRAPEASMFISNALPRAGEEIRLGAEWDDRDMSGGVTQFLWVVDGTPVTDQNFTWTFPTVGLKTVTLQVVDGDGGRSDLIIRQITVTEALPTANFTMSPAIASDRQPVTFNDTSTTPNPPLRSWSWNFGDGSPTFETSVLEERNPTHTYQNPGPYTVNLTVVDNAGRSDTMLRTIMVNARPNAGFVYTITPSMSDTQVSFQDTSFDINGWIDHRVWNFGDGSTLTTNLTLFNHSYASPGPKNVTLTVIDNDGGISSVSKTIHIVNHAPIAGFTVLTAPPQANAGVHFKSSGIATDIDGNHTIRFWSWDFGDGQTLIGDDPAYADPVHVYAASGSYRVSLIVGDGVDLSARFVKVIRVGADHDLTVCVRGKLPNGGYADLRSPHVTTHFSLAPVGIASVNLGRNDMQTCTNGGAFIVHAGIWAAGDSVKISMRDDRMVSLFPIQATLTLEDAFGSGNIPVVEINIPMPLVATITPEGDGEDDVFGFGNDSGVDGPIYHSLNEPFHGTGNVSYADGAPAEGARVVVELRYLAGKLPGNGGDLRDGLPPEYNNVLGWCKAAVTITNETGFFVWAVQDSDCYFPSDCALPVSQPCSPTKQPIFMFGRWEVRAVASHEGATSATSEPAAIYVDPTGIFAKTYLP